jgi:hypothetical protein
VLAIAHRKDPLVSAQQDCCPRHGTEQWPLVAADSVAHPGACPRTMKRGGRPERQPKVGQRLGRPAEDEARALRSIQFTAGDGISTTAGLGSQAQGQTPAGVGSNASHPCWRSGLFFRAVASLGDAPGILARTCVGPCTSRIGDLCSGAVPGGTSHSPVALLAGAAVPAAGKRGGSQGDGPARRPALHSFPSRDFSIAQAQRLLHWPFVHSF